MKKSHAITLSSVMTLSMTAVAPALAQQNYKVVPIEDGFGSNPVFAIAFNDADETLLAVSNSDTGRFNSYLLADSIRYIPMLDELNEQGSYSFNLSSYAAQINNGSQIVANTMAPFVERQYTNDEGVVVDYSTTEFWRRGVFIEGETLTVLSPQLDASYSFSEANDINDIDHVAGSVSFRYSSALQAAIDACLDDDARGSIPFDLCEASIAQTEGSELFSELADTGRQEIRAAVWQRGEQGQWQYQTYPHLIQPDADDERLFFSRGIAINNAGVLVGESSDYYKDATAFNSDTRIVTTYPAIFSAQGTRGFLDQDVYIGGRAVDVNESNQVVGYGEKSVSNSTKKTLFVYDIDSDQLTTPNGFYGESTSVPMAINESGMVVGYADVNANSSNRYSGVSATTRVNGFLFDSTDDNDQIINLNERIACNSEYTILRATDISENGTILAEIARSVAVTDENGEQQTVVSLKSAKLIPDNSIESCDAEQDTDEQSGSGTSWYLLVISALVLVIRRRFTFL